MGRRRSPRIGAAYPDRTASDSAAAGSVTAGRKRTRDEVEGHGTAPRRSQRQRIEAADATRDALREEGWTPQNFGYLLGMDGHDMAEVMRDISETLLEPPRCRAPLRLSRKLWWVRRPRGGALVAVDHSRRGDSWFALRGRRRERVDN